MIEADTDKPPAPASGEAPSIEVTDATGRLAGGDVAWLEAQAAAAGALLSARGEVRVRIAADDEMSRAHARFKGIQGPTDVLTFDLGDGDRLDVDILVCLDEAQRQGCARRHPALRELLLYILHGMLHCLGHDDRSDRDAARMHDMEDRLLESLGIGATYARPESGTEDPP
jgi:probable rRNA maturation factor